MQRTFSPLYQLISFKTISATSLKLLNLTEDDNRKQRKLGHLKNKKKLEEISLYFSKQKQKKKRNKEERNLSTKNLQNHL